MEISEIQAQRLKITSFTEGYLAACSYFEGLKKEEEQREAEDLLKASTTKQDAATGV